MTLTQFSGRTAHVPYQSAKERVDVRLIPSAVEVLPKRRRVASYKRLYGKGKFKRPCEAAL
ncbi:MAG: hypothetical protein IMW97_02090 [Firmicutes bacterium]|nr:hypothetical protein [Candidatus Fermentithermobacillaceae bacterium]